MPRALPRRAVAVLTGFALVLAGAVAVSPATAAPRPQSAVSPSPTATATPTPTPTPAPSKSFTSVGKPTVSGSPTVGRTLTAAPGSWAPTPSSVRYQWLRAGVAITGATSVTYVATSDDIDQDVAVRVTATRSGYTTTRATSSAVTVLRAFSSAPTPSISGTIAVGRTVTAAHESWAPTPTTLSYQWYRGSSAIAGATSRTYKLTTTDAGASVSVRVTAGKAGYTTTRRTSPAVKVPRVLTVPSRVAISGTPTVGSTLTASPGTWGPSPVTLRYQWLRDGVAITGATAKTRTLVTADAGHEISVRVSGSKSGYTSVNRTSAAVDAKYGFTSAPTPTVSGSVAAGRTLTAVTGTWAPTPQLAYQWRVDGAVVAGATAATWKVPEWAAGRTITVTVTATRSGYLTVTRTSPKRTASWSLGSTLRPGVPMRTGTYLASPNGVYRFTVQGDGNVVLSKNGVPQRTTRTTGTIDSILLLREDGALGVYSSGRTTPEWSAGTAGYAVVALTLDNSGALRLVEVDGVSTWTGKKLAAFSDTSAATASVPGKYGWAFPIRPSASMTTYSGHSGDDFAARTGTPVYAMRGGKVTVQEIWITSGCPSWAPNNTRQKQVLVETKIDGTSFVLTYAHLSAFSVKNGQTVKAGQKIGEVGSTGCSTGPHLHLAMKVDGVAKLLYPRDVLLGATY
ncbi:MAG: peptidoglycan DD-metalloendopeptidase family protein [Candidatus Microbacterium phytovorans]|uniref:Peptidoglycan DD-metalloendopeptidase family protein n=1 Tax=Candidatus Microbacterium phytovorans TaxID=3121374 RepID=A0AAJ6B4B6_9MICO|nr:peptidoglycan DD-metalloendopeptidase family protein [Microbacterium sp.]WEK14733.1 MAG: peptidoglycan DD-metalloendopeptidase family protein [Microbacterium sp.]